MRAAGILWAFVLASKFREEIRDHDPSQAEYL